MQAITTKYFGPTNTKGSRIKATCWAGSITIAYPHEVNSSESKYKIAAEKLLEKLVKENVLADRFCIIAGGSNPDGQGFTFIIG